MTAHRITGIIQRLAVGATTFADNMLHAAADLTKHDRIDDCIDGRWRAPRYGSSPAGGTPVERAQ